MVSKILYKSWSPEAQKRKMKYKNCVQNCARHTTEKGCLKNKNTFRYKNIQACEGGCRLPHGFWGRSKIK